MHVLIQNGYEKFTKLEKKDRLFKYLNVKVGMGTIYLYNVCGILNYNSFL